MTFSILLPHRFCTAAVHTSSMVHSTVPQVFNTSTCSMSLIVLLMTLPQMAFDPIEPRSQKQSLGLESPFNMSLLVLMLGKETGFQALADLPLQRHVPFVQLPPPPPQIVPLSSTMPHSLDNLIFFKCPG